MCGVWGYVMVYGVGVVCDGVVWSGVWYVMVLHELLLYR